MTTTTKQYWELTYITNSEAHQLTIMDNVRSMLKALGHKQLDEYEEGTKTLFYPIDGCEKGTYHRVVFEKNPDTDLQALSLYMRELRGSLRYLILTCSGEYKPNKQEAGA